MTLKVFVLDRGWAGAEMYISESKDKAVEYFRNEHLPRLRKGSENHIKHTPERDNPWLREIKYFESPTFYDMIRGYECVEGMTFETAGE